MKLFAIGIVILAMAFPVFGLASDIGGEISFQGDTVHLEFVGRSQWNYDAKKINKAERPVFQMIVEPLSDQFVRRLESFKNDYITAISVNTKYTDGKHLVEFVLSNDSIDAFDYLTDQPSRLIVDFYPDPEKPVKQAKVKSSDKETAVGEPTRKPAMADVLQIGQQGPLVATNLNSAPLSPLKNTAEVSAPRAGIFDGGDPDYERFSVKDYEIKEDAIIASQDKYYIPFPMLLAESEVWQQVNIAPTIYQVRPKDTEENKMARLLLTLFEKKRPLVFLKTAKWFHEKYPTSEYKELIEFMTADVHYQLWEEKKSAPDFDQAMLQYKKLVEKYPTNPLSERVSLRMGTIALAKKDAISALKYFNQHIGNPNFNDSSLSKDLAKIGTALAYQLLNRHDEAYAIYDALEGASKFKDIKVEAAFRKGDVYTRKGDAIKNLPTEHKLAWEKAVKEYESAKKKYPDFTEKYPNAAYNQAEAFFWQKKYPEALEGYRNFVKKFPVHSHAPFAMTRIGEVMDILGADPTRVMGAYMETNFRYGESPEAAIARMRLLSGRMKGMKPKEVEAAMKELPELSKRLDLPEMQQFTAVMINDGLSSRGEYEKAAEGLIKYYQANPVTADRKMLTKRIVNNINSKIVELVDKGDFISALKTHSSYWDKWLRNSQRLDTKFYIGKAFEDAGVDVQAENFYKEVLNRSYSLKGSKAEKELAIVERIPSEDRLSLRLSSVYQKQGKLKQAYDMLRNIKSPEKMSEGEQIERVSLAVKLLESRGENESAIRYLTELLKTWKGQPAMVAGPYLKLAELEQKVGRVNDALASLDKIDVMMKDSSNVPADIHLASLQKKADIYLGMGKRDQAVPVLENILANYEEKKPLGSVRYKLGEIYFNRGDLAKAANTWQEFKGEKTEFWQNLAQEKLKDAEWVDGYKKYMKRIPAMSTERSTEKSTEKSTEE